MKAMQQRKLVNALNNIHQNRQFMAFESCEVILIKQQHPTVFNFINLEALQHFQHMELNHTKAFKTD